MDRETLSLYVCVYEYNKIVQCKLHPKKAIPCGYTGKNIFFIQTMQLIEKQHKVTLKALILVHFLVLNLYL